jgi:hypothetical protein
MRVLAHALPSAKLFHSLPTDSRSSRLSALFAPGRDFSPRAYPSYSIPPVSQSAYPASHSRRSLRLAASSQGRGGGNKESSVLYTGQCRRRVQGPIRKGI